MKNKPIISADMLKAFFRYEITQDELYASVKNIPYEEIECEEYYIQWDDFRALIDNLKTEDPTYSEFNDKWVTVMEDDYLIIDSLLFSDPESFEMFYEEDDDKDPDNVISAMETVLASLLGDNYEIITYDKNVCSLYDFNLMLKSIALYEKGEYEKVDPFFWSDFDKLFLIDKLSQGSFRKHLSKEELSVYKAVVEEMCLKNYPKAIETKGYSCYGGDELYECDWETARDCMIRLMDHEFVDDQKKGQYANTLGYIYYYGRCSGGTPDYENAFFYFSVGAACGYYESRYKLADMFLSGKGVPVNKSAAYHLITDVYKENLIRFQNGDYGCKLADAALRMSSLFKDGIAFSSEENAPYYYALIADLAIRLRMKKHDHYGDASVAESIKKQLEMTRPLDFKEGRKSLTVDFPELFNGLFYNGRAALFTIKPLKDGFKVIGIPLPKRGDAFSPRVVVTIPECGYCKLQQSIAYTFKNGFYETNDHQLEFRADSIDFHWSMDEAVIAFYRGDELVATIHTTKCVFKLPAGNSSKKHTIASVEFFPGGRTYDYLADGTSVSEGDIVFVDTKDGLEQVTVVRVLQLTEDELVMPLSSYKSIKVIGII